MPIHIILYKCFSTLLLFSSLTCHMHCEFNLYSNRWAISSKHIFKKSERTKIPRLTSSINLQLEKRGLFKDTFIIFIISSSSYMQIILVTSSGLCISLTDLLWRLSSRKKKLLYIFLLMYIYCFYN